MVSKVVKKNLVNLQRLAAASPKRAREILKHSGKDLYEALRQCVINVLNGVVSVSAAQKAVLRKYKKKLRDIANKKTPVKKRKTLIQTGSGFIIPLITAVLPHIISGIASLIKSKKN